MTLCSWKDILPLWLVFNILKQTIMLRFLKQIISLLVAPFGFLNTASCAVITAGLSLDCDFPLVGGVKDDIILMNLDDIDSVTRNGSNAQVIEAVTKATGKTGFKFEGKNNSVDPQVSLVKQRYSEVYDHEVMFKVFTNDPTTKLQLEKLVQGKVVAFVHNNHVNSAGNSAFEIYGLSQGLDCVELTRVLNDADTQGAWNVVLRTNEQTKEPHLPNPLFITDYATTLAVFNGLLT